MTPDEPLRSALKRLLLTPDDDGCLRATRVIYAKPDGRERLLPLIVFPPREAA